MSPWKRVAVGAAVGASCIFALIAANIAVGDPLAALDVEAAGWMHAHRTTALTLLMLAVTHAHAPAALCVYAAVVAFLFHRRGLRRWLLALVLAVPVGLALNVGLKYLFRRSRPVIDDPLMTLSTFSFPSGHTAGATLFYGILAAYAVSRTRSVHLRAASIAAWLGLTALVAFSRVYLGVHYLSDVVAAAAWSLAWLAVSLLIASRIGFDNRHSPS
jgi:membrane-associated phospholipid phosphatase